MARRRHIFFAGYHREYSTRAGTWRYFNDGDVGAVVMPKTEWKVSRIGMAPCAWANGLMSAMEQLKAIREPVLQGDNNFVQVHLTNDTSQEVAVQAMNEILNDGRYTRDQMVVSAVIDDAKMLAPGALQDALPGVEIDLGLLRVQDPQAMDGQVFHSLQRLVADGSIQKYGLALQTSPSRENLKQLPFDHDDFVALQFPVNVFEAVRTGVIEYCRAHSIFAIGERSMEALNREGKPMFLWDFEALNGEKVAQELKQAFEFAISVEKRYMEELYPQDEELPSPQEICWGHLLAHQHSTLSSYPEWIHIRDQQITRKFEQATKIFATEKDLRDFAYAYTVSTKNLLAALTNSLELIASQQAKDLSEELDQTYPNLSQSESLQDRSLRIALSSNVHTVLTHLNLNRSHLFSPAVYNNQV